MKTKTSKTIQTAPHCRKCGATDIDFTYTETNHGHEIDEHSALNMACYFLAELIKQETDDDPDAAQLELMGTTLARLATMQKVRQPADGAAETDEAQS